MTEPRLHHVQCLHPQGLHRVAYWEWGESENPRVLVCAHGLTRQGRDFDALAQQLQTHYRVICPDVVGRGESDWLSEGSGYALPQYVADMVVLLARLNVAQVDWIGTSMGGLIGLALASLPHSPLRRLVLNDVGPTMEWAAVDRIRSFVGQRMRYASEAEGLAALRAVSAGFGSFDDATWRERNRAMWRSDGEAGVRLHYDPRIADNFQALNPALLAAGEQQLWDAYDRLRLPTLLLRGADSDLLSAPTAQAMAARGPHARLVTLAGVGHAPMLDREPQWAPLRAFLQAP